MLIIPITWFCTSMSYFANCDRDYWRLTSIQPNLISQVIKQVKSSRNQVTETLRIAKNKLVTTFDCDFRWYCTVEHIIVK